MYNILKGIPTDHVFDYRRPHISFLYLIIEGPASDNVNI